MARAESRAKMGYLPIDEKHYEAILSLVTPATPAHRLLDPFAGEGAFLEAAARRWNMTPYANELDGERAAECIRRFGPIQAVRGDAERLRASSNAFSLCWNNPPYDVDKTSTGGDKRVEFRYLRHAWKWVQPGGVMLWVVYQSHLTERAAGFLAKNSRQVDVWALPGKHQNKYDQIIVAAVKGQPVKHPDHVYRDILAAKADPRILTVQPLPVYKLPPPRRDKRFFFAPDNIDPEQGQVLVDRYGAWRTQGFQSLLVPPQPVKEREPVVTPRPGHMALVLAAGIANGAVLDTQEYGLAAVRSTIERVEEVVSEETEPDEADPDRSVIQTKTRLKPQSQLTLLAADGQRVEIVGDEGLLGFIRANRSALATYLNQRFQPLYDFRYNNLKPFLDRIRLNGKYPLYTAQKHVVAAVTRGLEERKGVLLIGSMGTGKTLMSGSVIAAMSSGLLSTFRQQVRPDQVMLVVCPPHLIRKWQRELLSIAPRATIRHLKRHEDVKRFMEGAAQQPGDVPKIGLIKRDMTKLGSGHEAAVIWRSVPKALWRHDQPTPEGYLPHQRIVKERVPTCPTCGTVVMQPGKGEAAPASKTWLKDGKRTCEVCQSPLWQAKRDSGSKPRPGEVFPRKNPRYRLDEYIKRQYPDRVYLLCWDEVHEAQHSDTGNGAAFGRLANVAEKVLALTGTPFNGKVSSIFNLEYHLNDRVKQQYPWGGAPRLSRKDRQARGAHWQVVLDGDDRQRGRSESRWVDDMGVREQVTEERPTYDAETGAYTGTSTYQRPYEEAPGISPLLIASLLDHSVFFSLGDLGKHLPDYDEIAVPVEMDANVENTYDRVNKHLKDYLTQRRWEGDVSFRGAYLQWALGWPNTAYRPYEIIHNIRSPLTRQKRPYTVERLPAETGYDLFSKEEVLIDMLREELAAGRPCVIYVRQTNKRDIQPRLARLVKDHVPGAKPYILRQKVSAERREKVIQQQVAAGTNILICNPELVKTGLDLLNYPTLIFYEIIYNLSTMMQASARAYRLNQTHDLCKVVYMYYEGTMEHTAVELMSRKQRAAKLLTGDIGLSGLDELTEGEGGFEAALLDAIAKEGSLVDPSQMFKREVETDAVYQADAAFWNVGEDDEAPKETIPALPEPQMPDVVAEKEPLPEVHPAAVAEGQPFQPKLFDF